jgi:hypothetical protein
MHFTYRFPEGDLKQGDLIQITDELRQVLSQFHPHYATKADYSFLAVLTQSCDLTMRNGKCASRYITLAAVRPLITLVVRELEKHQRSNMEKDNMLCSSEKQHWVREFVIKLLNNNLPEYFYLAEDAEVGIQEPHVIFLTLSVAIKSEHYDICQKARFGQLEEIFRAKLGWLVGHIYSRVATPDWVPTRIKNQEDFDTLVDQMLDSMAIWVSDAILERLRAEQKRRRRELHNNAYRLPKKDVIELLEKYIEEEEKEGKRENVARFVVEQVSKILTEVEKDRLKELEYNLVNNEEFEKLLS